jgi:hypothetical protein
MRDDKYDANGIALLVIDRYADYRSRAEGHLNKMDVSEPSKAEFQPDSEALRFEGGSCATVF